MSFRLLASNYTAGLEPNAMLLLETLKKFATLGTPITEAVMRAEVDAGQASAISDAGWLNLTGQLSSLDVDPSFLTATEAGVINTLREINDPAPQTYCCGVATPVDGLVSIVASALPASGTWEHTITITCDATVTCDLKKISLNLTPFSGGAPAITTVEPASVAFDRCSTTGNSEWVYNWYTFAANPSTEQYTVDYDFIKYDGTSITSFTATAKLTMP